MKLDCKGVLEIRYLVVNQENYAILYSYFNNCQLMHFTQLLRYALPFKLTILLSFLSLLLNIKFYITYLITKYMFMYSLQNELLLMVEGNHTTRCNSAYIIIHYPRNRFCLHLHLFCLSDFQHWHWLTAIFYILSYLIYVSHIYIYIFL